MKKLVIIVVVVATLIAGSAVGSSATIYFGLQEHGGIVQYSVRIGAIVRAGTRPYGVSGQIGRKIQIQIDPDGSVNIDQLPCF